MAIRPEQFLAGVITIDPTSTDLVLFRESAKLAHDQFCTGDNVIAAGDACTHAGEDEAARKQCIAFRIGHGNDITCFTVGRGAPECDTAAGGSWPGVGAAGIRGA